MSAATNNLSPCSQQLMRFDTTVDAHLLSPSKAKSQIFFLNKFDARSGIKFETYRKLRPEQYTASNQRTQSQA